MNVSDVAGAAIAPKVLKGFRFSWLVYGAAAYFGIRFLYKRGILPKQTGAALNAMDKGIDYAKNQIGSRLGFQPDRSSTDFSRNRQEQTTH
jgi:hypothetical protein